MDILSSLLSQNTTKESNYEKVFWFVKVMKWIQKPNDSEKKSSKIEITYSVRIKYLLLMLNNNPEWKFNFVTTITDLLLNISSMSPLMNVGISANTSFIQDFVFRVQEKVLPSSPLSEDLASLLYEVFPDSKESASVGTVDELLLTELLQLFKEQIILKERLQGDILMASYVLSVQMLNSIFSIQNELLDFGKKPESFPEFRISDILRDHQEKLNFKLASNVFSQLDLAEKNISELYSEMPERGVKIDLVYIFETQKRRMRRLRGLLGFFDSNISNAQAFKIFISQIIIDIHHQRSLKSFFSENLSLITERIVQANSEIGEHYVTFNWLQFRKMFNAAMGGGAITAITVFIKFGLSNFKLVGFAKGLVESLNYSSSFLLIQILGWTLATKQPSATAPYIASSLLKSMTESRKAIVALLRTQFIAVLGNLSTVFPICFFVSWICLKLDHPMLSADHALEQFSSTYFFGPSVLYAIFTGGLLFAASLFAGWFENWTLINRLQSRLRNSERLHRIFGENKTFRFAEFVEKNANSLAANITLGFLLGLSPQIMKFFGIPLETRHITLATGGFATALPIVIQQGITVWQCVNAVSGLLLIGFLNLSVSFSLAFLVASISSKVNFKSLLHLLNWGVRLMLTRPWLIIVPEKEKELVE
ncbi:MAG: hypothetical protein WA160_05780 [Pseudobdellovibrio sp.]